MGMEIRLMESAENFSVYKKLDGLERLTKRATRRGMFLWARDLKRTAQFEILHGKKTGKIYFTRVGAGGAKRKTRRRHQSSAPGETHAQLTGDARRAVSWMVTGSDRLEFGYSVSPDSPEHQEYFHYLEFGTPKGQMKPRPTIQNAINSTTSNAEEYFEQEIKKL